MQRILSYLRRTIDNYNMIEEGDKIAVGLSGGKDSFTLLMGLKALQRKKKKKNASISGAEVGCQGEIGAACAMASGAAAQAFGGSTSQIEYAAEMGLEHHLGLTCDPICGLVQVPCIERNAFAAARALDSSTFSILSDGRHLVSFDKIVRTMNQTGHDLPSIYKETSTGGLALDL